MKNFRRENLLFSLCGLNCGLCPMNLNEYCPGCGGGEGNQSCSLAKCRLLGIETYLAEQQKKKLLLHHLLDTYNDGRKKTLFCLAANLLELNDLENILSELDEHTSDLTLKEKASRAASLLQEAARGKNIELKLRKQKNDCRADRTAAVEKNR